MRNPGTPLSRYNSSKTIEMKAQRKSHIATTDSISQKNTRSRFLRVAMSHLLAGLVQDSEEATLAKVDGGDG